MFIELVDSLRCLEPHEDTWLVAAVTRMDGRHVADGVLGCPICRREYLIRDGVAWFTAAAPDSSRLTRVTQSPNSDRAMRGGALLGLTDAGGIVCVDAGWSDCADALAEMGPAHVVTLNAWVDSVAEPVSMLVIDEKLPFASAGLRGIAIADGSITKIEAAAACLRTRGRLVAPALLPIPDGVTELARDEAVWVGERVGVTSPPIALRLARR